jgi:hypothetical protein
MGKITEESDTTGKGLFEIRREQRLFRKSHGKVPRSQSNPRPAIWTAMPILAEIGTTTTTAVSLPLAGRFFDCDQHTAALPSGQI